MPSRSHSDPDRAVLSETVATRLLERASELDASRSGGFALADLRAAAAEAGISAPSFESALAELRAAEQAQVPDVVALPRRRPRRRALLAAVAAAFVALGGLLLVREVVPASPPTVEEPMVLRCLGPEEAATLIRPIMMDEWSSMWFTPRSPRVLTVRTTPAQLERVKETIERYDGAASTACAARGPGAATP